MWYIDNAGRPVGPVSEMEFRDAVADEPVRRASLVWFEGLAQWRFYGDAERIPDRYGIAPQTTGSTAQRSL
jgi:hypothetical protein